MKLRIFGAGLLTAALCIGVFGSASAETRWVTERLAIRTLKAATPDGGANDSLTASLGAAATLDTTVAFKYPVRSIPNVPDSNQFVIAHITLASALASGESLYVQVEGSLDNGATWRAFNVGTISPFSVMTGGAVQQGIVIITPKANSATNVTGNSPVLSPQQFYGGWFGFPKLRFKISSDRSGVMTQTNSYQIWASYVTDK